jgi:hypothetical protein
MGAIHGTIENLLNEYDVARITGLSVASVRRWRPSNRYEVNPGVWE